ncbi:MAG: glycosyltransferase family 4 protein [Planctomycetes bacterium]|nr:glycosyltransferase family 4 protein [Planctomycetota bacterium]
MATIREFSLNYGAEVHVVHWDTKKLTPFQHQPVNKVSFYGRSLHSIAKIRELAVQVNPDLVVVSGWQDKGYLQVARMLKKKGVPAVTGFDDQWFGTFRQRGASSLKFYLKLYFSHAWVSGPYQFEYARRLGFKKSEIVFDLYSADLSIYNDVYNESIDTKKKRYPHRFLFVGRFERIKAVELLVKAWHKLNDKRKDWELQFIGNGSLKSFLQTQTGIMVHDFMQPDRLKDEITAAGCFILPSRSEPWGVVIHEFTAAGLPIICSDVCGAAPVFLVHGLNGYRFESENIDSLVEQMLKIINCDDQKLVEMSDVSHQLGQKITPSLSAANLLSIVKG